MRAAERTLSAGTWLIVFGAMLYSVLTVTPLAAGHTPAAWRWTSPILPVVVDAAVVIVVRLDAVLARLGGHGGWWPVTLRWMTGTMTLLLNVGNSALAGDGVGVAVHSVAPLLLIVTSETSLAYRRAIARALARLDAERAEAQQRERDEREARERRTREERDRERAMREQREHAEREHAERIERERREWEAAQERERREHEARMAREAREAADARRREEDQRREREREQRRNAARSPREHDGAAPRREPVNTPKSRPVNASEPGPVNATAAPVNGTEPRPVNTTVAVVKMPEHEARAAAREGVNTGRSVRETAELTGWSVGWVAARYQEAKADGGESAPPDAMGEAA
ncbi:hypothetical protein GTW54_16820 [Streptomyces sp. SID5468]|nr:hypothetical protein [Streptomyces sp. SID5468]